MAEPQRFAAIVGMAAALSMAATPAVAAELPTKSIAVQPDVMTLGVFDADSVNADNHRWYRYRRHNHVDAGDVLAGVLIIGGIAAIASAASNSNNQRRDDYRYRDYRRDDYRDRPYDYRERRGDSRYDGGRGIDNAVSMCVSRIERDVRVDQVDSVDRNGDGWRVTGTLYDGERFTCRIGEDGRIEDVDYGGRFSASAAQGNQLTDDRYQSAWNNVARDEQGRALDTSDAQRPAYPGGPIDGDTLEEEPTLGG